MNYPKFSSNEGVIEAAKAALGEALIEAVEKVGEIQLHVRCEATVDALRALRDTERERARPHVDLVHLSMGMSHDLEVAVAEGATLVRVGTAIFGARGGGNAVAATADTSAR